MSAIRYELIARIGKTRGLEGKVTVYPAEGLPFCLRAGLSCHVVPPSLYGPRHLTLETVDELGDGTIVVSFEEVSDIADAEELVGKGLMAAEQDLEFDATDSMDFWLGRTLQDERFGELGRIEEIIETPAHDVWVVRGEAGEVLVPVVDEFVLDVPQDIHQPITTRVPDGLVG